MFGMGSGYELIIVLVVVLLLFGKRLPGVMFSFGKSITEFKKGVNETDDESVGAIKEKSNDGADQN